MIKKSLLTTVLILSTLNVAAGRALPAPWQAGLPVLRQTGAPPPAGDIPPIAGDMLHAPQSAIPGTSEYMIGRVAVGVILPESDGSADPSTEDWTDDEVALVLREIEGAFAWWEAREPRAHLEFVYEWEIVPTSYEPIVHHWWEQSLWIPEAMAAQGFSGGDYFDLVRQYNHKLLDDYDADHAFTIFVVDSSNDRDGRFEDGHFAYAFVGGPFTVMTCGNDGYGPYNMDVVAAHEIGHVFGALDQHYAAHQPCTRRSGCLGVENQNSQYGDCAMDEASLMRGGTASFGRGALDYYARGQVGWRDSDCDGVLDPVDGVAGECRRVYLPAVGRPAGGA